VRARLEAINVNKFHGWLCQYAWKEEHCSHVLFCWHYEMWKSFLIGERRFMSDDVDCLTQKREMSIWLRLFSQMIMDAIPQPTMRSRLSPWVYLIFPLTLCDRLWSHSSCHLILLTAAVRVRVLHRWVRYLWDMEHSFAMYVPHVSLREGYKGNSKPDPNLLMGDV
jgi:hypothetical protein